MRWGVVAWLASAVLARASTDSQPLSIQLETAWPAVPIALEILLVFFHRFLISSCRGVRRETSCYASGRRQADK